MVRFWYLYHLSLAHEALHWSDSFCEGTDSQNAWNISRNLDFTTVCRSKIVKKQTQLKIKIRWYLCKYKFSKQDLKKKNHWYELSERIDSLNDSNSVHCSVHCCLFGACALLWRLQNAGNLFATLFICKFVVFLQESPFWKITKSLESCRCEENELFPVSVVYVLFHKDNEHKDVLVYSEAKYSNYMIPTQAVFTCNTHIHVGL